MRSRFYLAIPVVLLLGCGGGTGTDTDSVHGTVTMDGKPLENAAVEFIPEKGRPAYGMTDAEGKYVLEYSSSQSGAQPGKYTVRIRTGREARESDDGEMIAAVPETVPSQYNTDSTLTFEVKAGESNVADFPLKSEGKIEKVITTSQDD